MHAIALVGFRVLNEVFAVIAEFTVGGVGTLLAAQNDAAVQA